MDISYNWLKDLADFELGPDELAQKLTAAGLAVEVIHPVGEDFIFDIDLTSNRSDCLSHLGVAREITAVEPGAGFKDFVSDLEKPNYGGSKLVTIIDDDLCHRFTARIIRNVKIGPSPEWLVKRLEALGERAINNVADITNYVMLELGQPMHSFDLSKLAENRIVVRRARPGETIKTLDELERKLDENMLAICDAEKPVAVGGVMGGFDSGITERTTQVLLEVAYFERDSIRQTSRNLNLTTEASYRFERGVDIENLIRASNRATALICELAGGEAGEFVDAYPRHFEPNRIESEDINFATRRLTGLDVENEEIRRILAALGINSEPKESDSTIFISPSWRHDIAIEEDLVEEVARVVGFDRLESMLPPSGSAGEYQPFEMRKKNLRQTLVNLGFDEALSYSFIDARHDSVFELIPNFTSENLAEKFVSIKDPIIEGSTRMRTSILPGLLDAVRLNFNHQRRDLKLFEIGKVFSASDKENQLPNERELLALVLTGNETAENISLPVRELNFYDAKGALESAVQALHLPELEFAPGDVAHLRKGQSAEVLANGKKVGTLGRLSDDLAAGYKFKQPVFVAEIDMETLLENKETVVLYEPLPIFPAIVRDASLLVKRSVSYSDLKREIEYQNFELLRNLRFVDVYEGKGMAMDERSITIRFEYRSNERTLLEEEVESVHLVILEKLEETFDAKQRI